MNKNKLIQISSIMLGIIMSSMIASCANDDTGGEKEPDMGTNYNSNKALEREFPDAMDLEVPKVRQGSNIYFRSHWAKKHNSSETVKNFCYEYDASCYHTRWVAFSFDNVTKQRNVSRSDAWGEDLKLPSNVRLSYDSYSGSGYTRGHICASADRLFSKEANEQAFYMSNMSPQNYNFNSYYWAELETLIRNWANSDKFQKLYVCKGGTIAEGQRLSSFSTSNSRGERATVIVPKYYFMAILGESPNKTYQSIAFCMEHKDYGYNKSYPEAKLMQQHVLSVDELEEFTGIDFFCNLNDKLENNVEKGYNIDAWSWK